VKYSISTDCSGPKA